jgi:hypothetical protein
MGKRLAHLRMLWNLQASVVKDSHFLVRSIKVVVTATDIGRQV